jgi:hypothetical protein
MPEDSIKIGNIGNSYGDLRIKKDENGKCYWGIENWDGEMGWDEIPEHLFKTLLEFKA